VLGNPLTWDNPRYPLLVNNSWGGGMKVNESIARGMIDDASELGIDMFHLDAGWFRGVGDGYPDPKKFPNGLAAVADYAHRHRRRYYASHFLDQRCHPGSHNHVTVLEWGNEIFALIRMVV
jgi:Melibiase